MPFDISVLPVFLAVSFVLLITPGPDVAFIVATGVTEGRRPALWASAGIALAMFSHAVFAAVMQEQAKAQIDQAKREADAKISVMQEQLEHASDRQKAKIEKRIAEAKADLEARHAKLQEAGRLAREALAV